MPVHMPCGAPGQARRGEVSAGGAEPAQPSVQRSSTAHAAWHMHLPPETVRTTRADRTPVPTPAGPDLRLSAHGPCSSRPTGHQEPWHPGRGTLTRTAYPEAKNSQGQSPQGPLAGRDHQGLSLPGWSRLLVSKQLTALHSPTPETRPKRGLVRMVCARSSGGHLMLRPLSWGDLAGSALC